MDIAGDNINKVHTPRNKVCKLHLFSRNQACVSPFSVTSLSSILCKTGQGTVPSSASVRMFKMRGWKVEDGLKAGIRWALAPGASGHIPVVFTSSSGHWKIPSLIRSKEELNLIRWRQRGPRDRQNKARTTAIEADHKCAPWERLGSPGHSLRNTDNNDYLSTYSTSLFLSLFP